VVKILDFGLAKLRAQGDGSVSSEAATEKQIPDPGTVMGTVINPYYSVTKDGQSFLLNTIIELSPPHR